jgi:LPS sulfotransferase NodH
VFGAKIMWAYLDEFVAKLRQIPQYAVVPFQHLLGAVFPRLHYIYMTRRDTVRQAISHWKALQTNVWGWTGEPLPPLAQPPLFDFAAIDGLVQATIAHDAAWQRYFAMCSVTPLTVVYEELVEAYKETALRILRYLQVEIPPALMFGPRLMQKQADTQSEEWVQRYLEIKNRRGDR